MPDMPRPDNGHPGRPIIRARLTVTLPEGLVVEGEHRAFVSPTGEVGEREHAAWKERIIEERPGWNPRTFDVEGVVFEINDLPGLLLDLTKQAVAKAEQAGVRFLLEEAERTGGRVTVRTPTGQTFEVTGGASGVYTRPEPVPGRRPGRRRGRRRGEDGP